MFNCAKSHLLRIVFAGERERAREEWEIVSLNILFLSYLSRSLADRWGTTLDFTTC